MESLKKFTSFSYARYLFTDGRIILIDEFLKPEIRKEISELETIDDKELIFLEDKELAEDLEKLLEEMVAKEQEILFVFPGNGAKYPRTLSRVQRDFFSTNVYAKRFWSPGSDPVVMVGFILPDFFLITNVGTILVVDDVISSGKTMQKLYQKNAWRFTRAKWIGATWVSQVPKMKAKSGINGFERIVAACVVEGPNERRVPINSLSTLRQEPEISENYAKRHFSKKDADRFFCLIQQK